MDNEIEKEMRLRADAIIEEILDLKQDAINQIKNKAHPEVLVNTFEKIASLVIDLESLEAVIFIPDALKMEDLEKEFFFKERLPRVMKTLKRYHN